LWADEAQNFCTSYDMQFQATARSSRACTVYITQNLPSYYASFGSGEKAKYETQAFLGNLQTKIFHANTDVETNQWAADIIGKKWQQRENSNLSVQHAGDGFGSSGGGTSSSFGTTLSFRQRCTDSGPFHL
jgi:hypothetical protein